MIQRSTIDEGIGVMEGGKWSGVYMMACNSRPGVKHQENIGNRKTFNEVLA